MEDVIGWLASKKAIGGTMPTAVHPKWARKAHPGEVRGKNTEMSVPPWLTGSFI